MRKLDAANDAADVIGFGGDWAWLERTREWKLTASSGAEQERRAQKWKPPRTRSRPRSDGTERRPQLDNKNHAPGPYCCAT